MVLPSFSIYRVLDHEFEGLTDWSDQKKIDLREDRLYILVAGIAMLLAPLLALAQDFNGLTRFSLFAVSLLGLWLVIEYFEFRSHERGLLNDLLELRFDRLAALSATSLLTGFLIELINIYNQAWDYSQAVPFLEYRVLGVPPIIVLGWIPLLAICLSFFNIFFRSEEPLF